METSDFLRSLGLDSFADMANEESEQASRLESSFSWKGQKLQRRLICRLQANSESELVGLLRGFNESPMLVHLIQDHYQGEGNMVFASSLDVVIALIEKLSHGVFVITPACCLCDGSETSLFESLEKLRGFVKQIDGDVVVVLADIEVSDTTRKGSRSQLHLASDITLV